jgi:hypothetical protein
MDFILFVAIATIMNLSLHHLFPLNGDFKYKDLEIKSIDFALNIDEESCTKEPMVTFLYQSEKKQGFLNKNNIIYDESDPIKCPEKEISIENEHFKINQLKNHLKVKEKLKKF